MYVCVYVCAGGGWGVECLCGEGMGVLYYVTLKVLSVFALFQLIIGIAFFSDFLTYPRKLPASLQRLELIDPLEKPVRQKKAAGPGY